MTLHEKLAAHWTSQKIRHLGGANPDDIVRFEERNGVSVPKDFWAFLLDFNGTSEMAGTDYFRFLPLAEFGSSRDRNAMDFGEPFESTYPSKPDGFFVFADYLQWCYGYAINLSKDAVVNDVALIGGLTCDVVARSFTEFMEMYLRDDIRLHPRS